MSNIEHIKRFEEFELAHDHNMACHYCKTEPMFTLGMIEHYITQHAGVPISSAQTTTRSK